MISAHSPSFHIKKKIWISLLYNQKHIQGVPIKVHYEMGDVRIVLNITSLTMDSMTMILLLIDPTYVN